MSKGSGPTAPGVRGGHKLEPISSTSNQYGTFATAWRCVSCGDESSSRRAFEEDPCDDPILWAELGCPGDGLRVCEDCGAVFVGDYDDGPFYERDCVECGSVEIRRDDDPDVDADAVIQRRVA